MLHAYIVSKKRCAFLPGNIGCLAFITFNYKKVLKTIGNLYFVFYYL